MIAMNIQIFQGSLKKFNLGEHCPWISLISPNEYANLQMEANENLWAYLSSELKAHYYAWQNNQAEYTGIIQGNRVLSFLSMVTFKQKVKLKAFQQKSDIISWLTSDEQLEALQWILSFHEVVIPHKTCQTPPLSKNHLRTFPAKAKFWKIFETEIAQKFSLKDRELEYFSRVDIATSSNLFVMKSDVFDRYSTELFDLLAAINSQVENASKEEKIQSLDLIARRFLGFWLHLNKVSYCETHLIKI